MFWNLEDEGEAESGDESKASASSQSMKMELSNKLSFYKRNDKGPSSFPLFSHLILCIYFDDGNKVKKY